MPSVLPPPVFKDADSTPLSAFGGAPMGGAAKQGPSDFTRMISQAPAPVVPEVAKTPASSPTTKPAKRSIPLGLIVVINVVILATLALVFFLFLRTPEPTVPATPKAPQVKVPDAPKPPEAPKTP
jgi:hypothetical protein